MTQRKIDFQSPTQRRVMAQIQNAALHPLSLAGEIYYMPGKWGERLSVGKNVEVKVLRRGPKAKSAPLVIAHGIVSSKGDYMVHVPTLMFTVGTHRLFLVITDPGTERRVEFDLALYVNLQLTTQSQLIPPLEVPWGS